VNTRRIVCTALLLVLVPVTLVGSRQPDQNQVAASPNEKRDYLGGTESLALYLVRYEESRWLELDTPTGVEKLLYWHGAVRRLAGALRPETRDVPAVPRRDA